MNAIEFWTNESRIARDMLDQCLEVIAAANNKTLPPHLNNFDSIKAEAISLSKFYIYREKQAEQVIKSIMAR